MNGLFNSSILSPVSTLLVALVWLCPMVSTSQSPGQAAHLSTSQEIRLTGRTMGPIAYNVTVAHPPASVTEQQLQKEVQATLDRVNQLMSTYIPDSDVSRFNQSTSTDFQAVDAETAVVVARALEISQQTNGAFDITVAPAVNLWNFGPNKHQFEIPDDEAIAAVKTNVGYQKLEVRSDPPALRKSVPNLSIDLSAIAKGYAVDQVAKTLDEFACQQYMVEVGGEVFTRGERAGGGKWRVGVERPGKDLRQEITREIAEIAEISNVAMATSGDYRNFVEKDGQRYSHTIDPKTCRPVSHSLASACIVTDDCMTADAFATAVMVLGAEKGAELCRRMGIQFLTFDRDPSDDSSMIEDMSEGFPIKSSKADKPSEDIAAAKQSIWPTFIGAAVVFALVILGMAVGSIFGNKPVQGSCGGIANVTNDDGESTCGVCAKPTTDCVEQTVEN